MNDTIPIDGLRWADRWHIPNGKDSRVVPFPTNYPINLVLHGSEKPFEYGHFGVHLGTRDRLTFLGAPNTVIRGEFLDCRADSGTWGVRFSEEFSPSSVRTLEIPAGVAHTFWGLQGVTTINDFRTLLPPPESWIESDRDPMAAGDIINLPLDLKADEIPRLSPNPHRAGSKFYYVLAQYLEQTLTDQSFEFPFTEQIQFEGAPSSSLLKFIPSSPKHYDLPKWEPLGNLHGVGWSRHLFMGDHKESGLVVIPWRGIANLIDHGFREYHHDAYGIHLTGEDRLTFIGPPQKTIRLTLVDCRRGSATLHQREVHEFCPDTRRYLCIPPGVAHAFDGLESVFTLNRARPFVAPDGSRPDGPDVIDWPRDREDFPILDTLACEAPHSVYTRLAAAQEKMMETTPDFSAPFVLMAKDEQGEYVRVAFRETSGKE